MAAVDAEAVSTSMSLYLRGSDELPYERVHEVRAAIEIAVAGLAAERATDDEVRELADASKRFYEVMDDIEAVSDADVEFHRTLARLTHNDLFLIMLDSVGDVLLKIRRATLGIPDDAATGHRHHEAIVESVRQHDPTAAREAMRRHLESALEIWHELGPVPLTDERAK